MNLRDLDNIRGKMEAGVFVQEEVNAFLKYVTELENLLDEGDEDDCFGTEGWKHRLGLDE